MTIGQIRDCLGAVFLAALVSAVPSAAQTADEPSVRGFVSLGAGVVIPQEFTLVGTVSSGSNRAEFVTASGSRRRPVLDFGAGVVVRRRLSIGAAFSRYTGSWPGTLTVRLTHPAFHPTISADAATSPLDRTSTSLHMQAGYVFQFGERASLTLFGGPSHVSLTQDLIGDLDYDEDVDLITGRWYILGPAVGVGERTKASGWGYNAGADVTYQLSSIVGVGALARYTRATLDLDNLIQAEIDDLPATQSTSLGGLEITGGLRLRLAGSRAASGGTPAWEVEAHAGGALGSSPGGKVALPHVGGPFTAVDGSPSRTVPSWYFGEGAQIFGENAMSRGRSARISPLDPVLDTSAVAAALGRTFGVRLGRALTPRLGIEFSIDVSRGGLALTDDALATIEASRSTFEAGFSELLATSASVARAGQRVSSSSTLAAATGNQFIAAGALRLNLLRGRAFMPYAVVGGGLISQTGDLPTVALRGSYEFTSVSNTSYGQSDDVGVRFVSSNSFAPLVGAGFTQAITARGGIRADVRAYLAADNVAVLMNASGRTTRAARGAFRFDGTPSIQISGFDGPGSTLSEAVGAPFPASGADYLEVARGSGTRALVTFTVGYYWRF